MVICEVVVFLYWEFVAVQGYGAWDLVIAETSNILFFDVLVVPYLILNGNIHAQLRNIRKAHTKIVHVSMSNSRMNVNV
ncbi:hypothetical protein ANCCAN_01781 [Ancylostoma caninum]|uniref:Uncharacterized protein n=1 Tax=Ancylostoma caninum TaxID=29170 RepID=A0A368H606_ANCCA|nr:hypothetical protein ANCCAN_01781 [Ancylostoma caninum]